MQPNIIKLRLLETSRPKRNLACAAKPRKVAKVADSEVVPSVQPSSPDESPIISVTKSSNFGVSVIKDGSSNPKVSYKPTVIYRTVSIVGRNANSIFHLGFNRIIDNMFDNGLRKVGANTPEYNELERLRSGLRSGEVLNAFLRSCLVLMIGLTYRNLQITSRSFDYNIYPDLTEIEKTTLGYAKAMGTGGRNIIKSECEDSYLPTPLYDFIVNFFRPIKVIRDGKVTYFVPILGDEKMKDTLDDFFDNKYVYSGSSVRRVIGDVSDTTFFRKYLSVKNILGWRNLVFPEDFTCAGSTDINMLWHSCGAYMENSNCLNFSFNNDLISTNLNFSDNNQYFKSVSELAPNSFNDILGFNIYLKDDYLFNYVGKGKIFDKVDFSDIEEVVVDEVIVEDNTTEQVTRDDVNKSKPESATEWHSFVLPGVVATCLYNEGYFHFIDRDNRLQARFTTIKGNSAEHSVLLLLDYIITDSTPPSIDSNECLNLNTSFLNVEAVVSETRNDLFDIFS